ncbi:hypothetical protein D3C75_701360 [compost metagenome]
MGVSSENPIVDKCGGIAAVGIGNACAQTHVQLALADLQLFHHRFLLGYLAPGRLHLVDSSSRTLQIKGLNGESLYFLHGGIADHIQINGRFGQPLPVIFVQTCRCNSVNGVQPSQGMETVGLLLAHFLNAALRGVPDFIVNDSLQPFLQSQLFGIHILAGKSGVFNERAGQGIPEKGQSFGEQAGCSGHIPVIDDIHAELDNLVIAALVDIEAEAGSVHIVQLFPEALGFGQLPGASPQDKGSKCSGRNLIFCQRCPYVGRNGVSFEPVGWPDMESHPVNAIANEGWFIQ